MKTNQLIIASLASLASLVAACAASDTGPGSSEGTGGSAGPTTGTGPGTGAGATSGPTTSSGGMNVTLPLDISSVFVPSGYMGDGETAGSVVMMPLKPTDPQDCGGDRSPPAIGICYTVSYMPVAMGKGWAGVYWQYPADNWGAMPGLDIPAGAKQVSAWAKGGAGGEMLTLVAGGIESAGMTYQDSFKANTVATLTTSWAEYTFMLPTTYGPVLGGFAWSVGAPMGGGSVSFSIDSIEWE
jgi:hypothetical protein